MWHHSQGRERPLFIAHRAYQPDFPENTLPSLEACIARGCDAVEVDIRPSRDGLVVFHDRSLKRMMGYPLRVGELTLSQLQSLTFEDTRITIPSLPELLTRMREINAARRQSDQPAIGLALDIKNERGEFWVQVRGELKRRAGRRTESLQTQDYAFVEALAAQLAEEVAQGAQPQDFLVMAQDHLFLREFQKRTEGLFPVQASLFGAGDMKKLMRQFGEHPPAAIGLPVGVVRAAQIAHGIEAAHRHCLAYFPYGVSKFVKRAAEHPAEPSLREFADKFRALLTHGADAINTDDVPTARAMTDRYLALARR